MAPSCIKLSLVKSCNCLLLETVIDQTGRRVGAEVGKTVGTGVIGTGVAEVVGIWVGAYVGLGVGLAKKGCRDSTTG